MTGRRMKNRLCSVRRRHRCTVRRKRLAYGVVGLLVCLTGALGNAVVTANLQLLQGTFAAWSTEIAWLPAVYVMTNVSINLLLVKFRQQFGLRAFTEGFLVLYVLVTFFHLFVNDLSSAMMVRAAHGMVGRGAQLAGDLLPGTGLACAPSPERADYRHHRLVAGHSPGAPLFHRTAADR